MTSVFETYHRADWQRTIRMAPLTTDTAPHIATEPGVWLRTRGNGWEVFTADGWTPAGPGDYVVRHGHAPDQTAVITAQYAHQHYTREHT
jgi:hypothetical protein